MVSDKTKGTRPRANVAKGRVATRAEEHKTSGTSALGLNGGHHAGKAEYPRPSVKKTLS